MWEEHRQEIQEIVSEELKESRQKQFYWNILATFNGINLWIIWMCFWAWLKNRKEAK